MLEDFRLALRKLAATPGITATAIATLALTIGANTAVLSIADAVLFRPLPYADPDRLVVIRRVDPRRGTVTSGVPYTYVQAIEEHHGGLGPVGLRGPTTMMTHGEGDAEWIETNAVTPEYLQILGIAPARGRPFQDSDAAERGRVVMLSYESWRTRFGGDESIVGRSVALGGRSRDVVGVLPRGFLFPSQILRFRDWLAGVPEFVTVRPTPRANTESQALAGLVVGDTADDPVVRLEPGITRVQAQAELDALVSSVGPPVDESTTPKLVLEDPRALLFPTGRGVLTLLLGAAGLVLLIGCANLTNLLLARARQREREIGLRVVLGAPRARILRPILLEAMLVAAVGALLAVAATFVTFDALLRHVPPAAYGHAAIGVDVRVGLQSMALSVIAGVLCAVVPVYRLARRYGRPFVETGGDRVARGIFERPVIVVQVALAVVLVSAAIVAGRAFTALLSIPLGFDPRNVITLDVDPPRRNRSQQRAFYVNAIRSLAERPDIVAVGAAGSTAVDRYAPDENLGLRDGSRLQMIVHVLPGYFETIGIQVRRGRLPAWDDVDAGASIAVVSEAAAGLLFAGRDPLGLTVSTADGRVLTVVGVVADVQMRLDRKVLPPVYAIPDVDNARLRLIARVRTRHQGTRDEIRKHVARLALGEPVTANWWSDSIDALTPYRTPRFQTLVLGSFAVLALGLTALGLFAVVRYVVTTRTREMGIRLAIGASPKALTALIIRQTAWPAAVGMVAGLSGVYFLRRIAEAHLAGIDAHDPLAIALAVASVGLAALAAAWLPARKASHVDPAVVLRGE